FGVPSAFTLTGVRFAAEPELVGAAVADGLYFAFGMSLYQPFHEVVIEQYLYCAIRLYQLALADVWTLLGETRGLIRRRRSPISNSHKRISTSCFRRTESTALSFSQAITSLSSYALVSIC